MKINTEPVASNNKTENSRLVMSAVYAAMMTVASAIMIKASPEASQIFTANPVATAATVSLAIVGALKFINKGIDAMLSDEAEDLGTTKPLQTAKPKMCASADDIRSEMDRLSAKPESEKVTQTKNSIR